VALANERPSPPNANWKGRIGSKKKRKTSAGHIVGAEKLFWARSIPYRLIDISELSVHELLTGKLWKEEENGICLKPSMRQKSEGG